MGDTTLPPDSGGSEREVFANYWREHSTQCTVEAMMLDSAASVIDAHERPEILRLLGDMAGKEVLELGAGIGRFTGVLAQVRACHQDTASEASMSRATMPKSRGRAELQAHHGGGLHASSD